MTSASRSQDTLASHAVCAAAGARDGLRMAQFFVRDLSGAENWGRAADRAGDAKPPSAFTFSPIISRLARIADKVMTWTVNRWIALTVPEWRKLPSPFTHGMLNDVAHAIRAESFVVNPLFNTYFYRAAIHILRRYRAPPFLVLEHRVDAARRGLLQEKGSEPETEFLARALIALVEAAPVARAGGPGKASLIAASADPNIAVYAIACVALLFAEEGKPAKAFDEDEFFSVVGALIGPRLDRLAELAVRRDQPGLARELAEIKGLY
jgi:hypothetical protein